MRRSLSVARGPTLACLIFGAACAPTIAQGDAERIHVNLPTAHADQLVSDAENLNLAVTTADLDGLRPEQPGFKAPAGGGECKIYLDRRTPVSAEELFEESFSHLDSVVIRAGGIDAIMKTPEKIPSVSIWGDSVAPWRCIATAIDHVHMAGYPGLNFIVVPPKVERDDPAATMPQAIYFDLPVPNDPTEADSVSNSHKVALTASGGVLLNGGTITLASLKTSLNGMVLSEPDRVFRFEVDERTNYALAVAVLSAMKQAGIATLSFERSETSENHSANGTSK